MPVTVLLSLIVRPVFALVDPVVAYLVAVSTVIAVWAGAVHRFALAEAKALGLGLGLFNFRCS